MSEFVSEGRKEGGMSLYGEEKTIRSITAWKGDDTVIAKGVEYAARLEEDLVPRQREVLNRLFGRVAFEITMRRREAESLEQLYEADAYQKEATEV